MVKIRTMNKRLKLKLNRTEPENDKETVCYLEHLQDDRVYIVLQNPFDTIGCPSIWRSGKWIKRNWRSMDAKILHGVRHLKSGYTYLQIGDNHGFCISRTSIKLGEKRRKPASKPSKAKSAVSTLPESKNASRAVRRAFKIRLKKPSK